MGNQQYSYNYGQEYDNDMYDSGYEERNNSGSSSASSSPDTSLGVERALTEAEASEKKALHVVTSARKKSFFAEEQTTTTTVTTAQLDNADTANYASYTTSKRRLSIVKSKSIGISIANSNNSSSNGSSRRVTDQEDDCDEACSCKECKEVNTSVSVSWIFLLMLMLLFGPFVG